MGTNEQIVEIIKTKGPCLPIHISKLVNDSLLFTSARLSELVASKKLRISYLKVGGSPLYYFPGQEERLQDFSLHLKGIEKDAYALLKEQKVVSEEMLEPAVRVAIRGVKDFAIPLEVIFEDNKKTFWKWYLLPKEEAESAIKIILGRLQPIPEQKKIESPPIPMPVPRVALEAIQQVEMARALPKKKIEIETRLSDIQSDAKPAEKVKKPRSASQKARKEPSVDFMRKVNEFFSSRKIRILQQTDIKKNGETNFIIQFDSTIGTVAYFCKSKDKKSITENDISHALVQAQEKRLPLLFIAPGSKNKKAEELLAQHHALFIEI